jgi:hypothetical protein
MKILHGGGFSDEEIASAIIHIQQNIFSGCEYLITQFLIEGSKIDHNGPEQNSNIDTKLDIESVKLVNVSY